MAKSRWLGWTLGFALALMVSMGGADTPPKPHIPAFFKVYAGPDGTLLAESTIGIVRSENGGEHWQTLDVGPGVLLPQKGRVLLIKQTGANVLSSRDGGLTWKTEGVMQDVRWSDVPRQIGPIDERGWLYLCHENVLRISPDAGINWHELRPPRGCQLAWVSEKVIYVLAAGVVQMSSNGGLTWRVIDAADDSARQVIDEATWLYPLSGRRTRLLAYSHADGAFHLSENGGRNWRRLGVGGFSPEEAVVIVGETTSRKRRDLFFYLQRDIRSGELPTVYRTADGTSSTPVGLPYGLSQWNLSRGMNDALYVVDHFYIYMSTDEGKTWKRLGRGGITPPGYEKLPSLLPSD